MQRLQPGNDETKMRVSPRFQVHPQKYFDRYFSLPLPLPLLISTARLDRGTTWTHRKSHPAAYRLRSRQRLRAPSSLARLLRSGGLSRRRRCPHSVARSMLRVLQSSFHFLFIILLWEIRVSGGGWRLAAGGWRRRIRNNFFRKFKDFSVFSTNFTMCKFTSYDK